VKPAFSPSLVVPVKALACELPHRRGLPLSRFSVEDIRQEVLAQGWIADIGGTTLWRWLIRDALCPWRHRTWIFPRDPRFAQNAGPILDLYADRWEGQPLGPNDFVISADEKTSIWARRRIHASLPPAPGRPSRQDLRPLRSHHRDCTFRPLGGRRHEPGTLPRVLDLRQRVVPPGPESRTPFAVPLAFYHSRPHAGSRQLAQPGRDLLLHHLAQSAYSQRFRRPCRSRGCSACLPVSLREIRGALSLDVHAGWSCRSHATPQSRRVAHLRPPTQSTIHEFSSKSIPVPIFEMETPDTRQLARRFEVSNLQRRRSSPSGLGFPDSCPIEAPGMNGCHGTHR
jgi:hypothetical protein